MRLTIFQKGVILVALPLAVQGLFLGGLAWFQQRYAEAQFWSLHTKTVLELGRRLEAGVLDIQAGTRGYVLTGDAAFLGPHAATGLAVLGDAERLVERVADNPTQQDRARRLNGQVRHTLDWHQAVIRQAQTAGREAGVAAVRRGEGQQLVGQLRADLAEFLGEEGRLEDERDRQLTQAQHDMSGLLIAGGLVTFLGTVALALFFSRSISRRLRVLTENTRRLAAGRELLAPAGGADEVAEVDQAFRQMAAELTALAADQRRATERIRDLYNHAPCGYHSLDADGVFLTINDTELDWLGRPRNEVEGKARFTDFLTPAGRQTFARAFPEFQKRGSIADLEFDLVRADGSELPVSLSATAVRDSAGQFVATRSTVFDITERRRADAAVRALNQELERRVAERTAELAEANRDLKHKNAENELFVYSVSHDLRSPLVNLQGFSKELGKACAALRGLLADERNHPEVRQPALALLDGKATKALGFIQTAVTRLSGIIDALLRLSRAGRVEYRWETVNVRRVVTQVLDALHGTVTEKGAAVHVRELPPAWGDATALGQVFANLIGNALTYLDPKRPGRIEVGGATEADGAVTYHVRDNGLGIPAVHHQKVFQLFQRVHPGVGPGEGLGLAIVGRVVDRHHGRVWVESKEGEGSTFFVRLPAGGPAVAARRVPGGSPGLNRDSPQRETT